MSGPKDQQPPKPSAAGADPDELELFEDPEPDDESVRAAEAELRALPEPPMPEAQPELEARPGAARPLRVIAIGGARGGVGKSVLAANLALYFSTIGRKVVLVDADSSGANLHSCLGMRKPVSLARAGRLGVRREGVALLEEALVKTPFPGLRLLHAGLDEPTSGARAERLVKLVSRLRALDAQYVVIDMGVGLGREVVDTYLAADLPIYVTLPEPTALENTYHFFRAAFARHVLRTARDAVERDSLSRHLKALGTTPAPLDLLEELERQRAPLAERVREAMAAFRPHVVVNQTRLRADLQLGFDMQSAARRRLGIGIEYMGHIDHDDTVWTCVRNRRPLLLEVPGAKSSKKLEKIARRVLAMEGQLQSPRAVERAARQSSRFARSGTRSDRRRDPARVQARARALRARLARLLRLARATRDRDAARSPRRVVRRSARSRAPQALRAFGLSAERARCAQACGRKPGARERAALPEITADTVFTGGLLREVRLAQRVSLRDVSQKTKIGLQYLQAIEDDDFARLPALVYASGFVSEFAKCLKLDPQHVSRTYVRRYKRYLEDRERGISR